MSEHCASVISVTSGERISVGAAVGLAVKTLRDSYGVSQDELATGLRQWGLTWARSSVANLEAGRRKLSAEELLLLPVALRSVLTVLSGRPADDVNLEYLLCAAPATLGKTLALADDASTKWHAIPHLLAGRIGHAETSGYDAPATRAHRAKLAADREQLRELRRRWAWNVELYAVREALDVGTDDATVNAASKLGVPVEGVALTAFKLWGHGLARERDSRLAAVDAAARTIQARRGHITRALIAELAAALPKED